MVWSLGWANAYQESDLSRVHIQNSLIQNSPIQNSSKNHEMKEKQSNTKQSGLRSQVGALRARRSFAAITGSKFRIKSYPLLASSQHVGAAAAITCSLCLLNKGQFSAYRLVKTIITWEYFCIIGLEKRQYAAVFEMDSIATEHE